MLRSLRVKNLALIRETEVEFGEGLNILTGETGAGKSLLIGSVNLATGRKVRERHAQTGRRERSGGTGLRLRGRKAGGKIKEHGSGTFGRRNRDPEPKTFPPGKASAASMERP